MREHHDLATPKMTVDFVFRGLVLRLENHQQIQPQEARRERIRVPESSSVSLEDDIVISVSTVHNAMHREPKAPVKPLAKSWKLAQLVECLTDMHEAPGKPGVTCYICKPPVLLRWSQKEEEEFKVILIYKRPCV